MKSVRLVFFICAAISFTLFAAAPTQAKPGPLVDVAWLRQALASGDVVVLDAQPLKLHEAGHIPGAVQVDMFAYGIDEKDAQAMQLRIESWGVSSNRTVVIYDQGATFLAPRLYYELLYRGHPIDRLHVLDGGLAKWKATGGAVTQEKTPAPAVGRFRITQRADVRADLPEVLAASGDGQRNALVDALDPDMYFGATKFFDRAGHLPHAVSWPTAELFNADKTFKSADEIRAMASQLGVRPEQQVYAYCGGGIAAAVPYFALRHIAGYPQVKLFVGSQLAWVQDSRELPLWSYASPQMVRSAPSLASWMNPMLRAYGVSRMNVVDIRAADAFAAGHIPAARNIPVALFNDALKQPAPLRARLESEGLDPAQEIVIVSERGLDKSSALAFVALQSLDIPRASVLATSTDEWTMRGLPWAKTSAPAKPTRYSATSRTVTTTLAESPAHMPRVYIASGAALPSEALPGPVVHLPSSRLVNDDGSVKPAGELWTAISKAGVPRYAQLVLVADDVGDAAINYYVLQLMGYNDLRVLTR